MFNNLLIVCIGNVCRSPTAERMFKMGKPNLNIHSAGIHALIDHPANESAYKIAGEHNLNLDNHCSKQLTKQHCLDADLILVMEKGHIQEVINIAPEVRGKVMLLGHWLNEREIPDPYKKSDEMYELTYELLDKSVSSWLGKI